MTAVSAQTLTLSTSSTFTVGKSSEALTFSWITSSPIIVNDIITITLPENYMQYGTVNPFISYSSGTRIAFTSTQLSTLSYQFQITSINSSSTNSFTVAPTQTIEISFLYVRCLLDASPRSLAVLVSRSNSLVSSGSLSITPNPNSLTLPTLSAPVKTVSASPVYTFTFKLTNSIPTSSGKISIQVPSSMQLTGSNPTCTISSSSNSESLSGSVTCAISTRTITLSGFLSNALPALASVSITVSGAFSNPLTTEPTGTFLLKTISAGGYTIDQNSELTYTATSDTISSLTIVPSSYLVADDTVYTLTYTPNKKLPSGTSIVVRIPSQITTLVTTTYTIKIGTGSATAIVPTSSTSSGKTVLTFTNAVSAELAAGTAIVLVATELHNPESLQSTDSFEMSVSSSTGYAIESVTSGKIITMQTMAAFSELTPLLSSSERING